MGVRGKGRAERGREWEVKWVVKWVAAGWVVIKGLVWRVVERVIEWVFDGVVGVCHIGRLEGVLEWVALGEARSRRSQEKVEG